MSAHIYVKKNLHGLKQAQIAKLTISYIKVCVSYTILLYKYTYSTCLFLKLIVYSRNICSNM